METQPQPTQPARSHRWYVSVAVAVGAMMIALAGDAAAADWGYCALELEQLGHASQEASFAAQHASTAESSLRSCRSYGERDCSSEASFYRSAVSSVELAFMDVERRLKNVEMFCGVVPKKAKPAPKSK